MSECWRYQYVEMPRKRSTRPRGRRSRYAACPARAKDTFRDTREWYHSRAAPGLWENRVLALSHATSTADRLHFVKNPNTSIQRTCPSRAPACADPDDHMPGEQVVISARHGAFICATNISVTGSAQSGWLPADAVASDQAEPVCGQRLARTLAS
jgi:hypothetical protein